MRVPRIYQIESFPTVHQMISTITGRLAPGLTAVDAIEVAFPGGSMTGAPKLRAVQLLRELEKGPRGVYSGAIGWLSPNGAASLRIVIRTAVLDETGARFGVGGAITRLSDTEAEIEETFTKARTCWQLSDRARGWDCASGMMKKIGVYWPEPGGGGQFFHREWRRSAMRGEKRAVKPGKWGLRLRAALD